MSTCAYCHRRKGKRACPALRGAICPTCCGEHRQAEIACPPDCRYLEPHGDYQRRRTFDRVPPEWIERLVSYDDSPESVQAILHQVQMVLCRYAADHAGFDHAEAREGLEFARERMSPIETLMHHAPPFGEMLVEKLEEVIEGGMLIEREGARQVLDETLEHLAEEVPADRFAEFVRFLRALYDEHLPRRAAADGAGIILAS